MVTDQQVRRLFKMIQSEKNFGIAAMKAGMDEKTARKYRRIEKLPGEIKQEHTWRTRKNPFEDVWKDVKSMLESNPGLEATTLFRALQRRFPGKFSDGQTRTLQRHIKYWRATEGPPKEVFFPQIHKPGELCQSDFTRMKELGITIGGVPFDHMIYHFVLTCSNWETGTICFSESFESLSHGLQNALWELGGIPQKHRTDCLAAAVNSSGDRRQFTFKYQDLMQHYSLVPGRTNPKSPHENGDVEQRNYRFKKAVDQALLLRGSRDFRDREEYGLFLKKLFTQLNAGRKKRFMEELSVLHRLPDRRIDSCKKKRVVVGPGSTVRVDHNVYSVDSRLIGESIEVRSYINRLEIWYRQRKVDILPRLRGGGKHKISYRHLIDSLIRKPGAFENYRYRDAMFPTIRFRIAYDRLKKQYSTKKASERYLSILYIAARESEIAVDNALDSLIGKNAPICKKQVRLLVKSGFKTSEVHVPQVDLACYDQLLEQVTSC